MKHTYSKLISESPIIYHIWYISTTLQHPGNILPSIIAEEISDTVTQLKIKDQVALIDTDDMISTVHKDRQGETGYLETGTGVKLQNIIMQFDNKVDKTKSVDHIDNNRLNNCSSNLRIATLSTQMRNRAVKKQPKSGHRGITEHGNKFDVAFNYNKKRYRAYFYDLQDAIKWRDQKMKEVIPTDELLEWRDLQNAPQ